MFLNLQEIGSIPLFQICELKPTKTGVSIVLNNTKRIHLEGASEKELKEQIQKSMAMPIANTMVMASINNLEQKVTKTLEACMGMVSLASKASDEAKSLCEKTIKLVSALEGETRQIINSIDSNMKIQYKDMQDQIKKLEDGSEKLNRILDSGYIS